MTHIQPMRCESRSAGEGGSFYKEPQTEAVLLIPEDVSLLGAMSGEPSPSCVAKGNSPRAKASRERGNNGENLPMWPH